MAEVEIEQKEVRCIRKHLKKARGRIEEEIKKIVSELFETEEYEKEERLKDVKEDLQVEKNTILSIYKRVLTFEGGNFPFNDLMSYCRDARHLFARMEEILIEYDWSLVVPVIDASHELGLASDHADNIQGGKKTEARRRE